REQRGNAEMVEQHGLRAHHVANGDHREVEAPGGAGPWVSGSGSGGAHAGAEHVRANDEIALGVDRPTWSDHGFPPARLLRDRMSIGNVLVAGEGVADQYRVAALGIERAIGLVSDLERREIDAGVEVKRLVGAEANDERMGIVGFARPVGGIERNGEIGLDHLYNPAAVIPLFFRCDRPTPQAAARRLDRPRDAAVNVFFAFSGRPEHNTPRASRDLSPWASHPAPKSPRSPSSGARSIVSTRTCTSC